MTSEPQDRESYADTQDRESYSTEDTYQNELVDRCAPRWAWEIIDAALDAQACGEKGPDSDKTGEAYEAMIRACEHEAQA